MRTIAELNMLLRARTELPEGLNLATDEFREGWNFLKTTNAERLEKKIHAHGWNFIKVRDESLRSGVGDTSQEAIASALRRSRWPSASPSRTWPFVSLRLPSWPWRFTNINPI